MVTTVRRLVARAFAAWEQFLFGKTDALPLAFSRTAHRWLDPPSRRRAQSQLFAKTSEVCGLLI